MRKLNEVIVHCSATKPEWMAGRPLTEKVNEIRKWHVRDRGWSDIGYHIIIGRDGSRMAGRPIEKPGAHTQGHNANSIGVCLLGGHGSAETDRFEQNFTPEQDKTLRAVLEELQEKYGKMKISGHNQYAAKACPGFQVDRWLANKPPAVVPKEVKGEASVAVGAATGVAAAVVAVGTTDNSASLAFLGVAGIAILAVVVFLIMRKK